MQNFTIKIHRVGTIYTKPHLFILNKGNNSGKPRKEPYTNSFVILFQNEQDCEDMLNIAESLMKSKYWQQFLCGSVIPFLRLPDFKRQLIPKAKIMMEEYEEHLKEVEALKLKALKEKQFLENMNLINDYYRGVLHRYSNR